VGAVLYTALIGLDTTKMMAEKTELFDLVAEFPAVWILPFSLFVGIHEEVLFRGFFLSRMRAVSRSSAVAIIVTSLIFGLLHFYQGLLGIFQTTMIGLFLAIVVTYSRTLWPAIIAHAVFDATNLLIMPWVLRAVKESGVT
jgi:membrane protease YdiL (CAAX protease family)